MPRPALVEASDRDPASDSEEARLPYESISDLPKSVRESLPTRAQEIYRRVFNAAWDEYADPRRRRSGASREASA